MQRKRVFYKGLCGEGGDIYILFNILKKRYWSILRYIHLFWMTVSDFFSRNKGFLHIISNKGSQTQQKGDKKLLKEKEKVIVFIIIKKEKENIKIILKRIKQKKKYFQVKYKTTNELKSRNKGFISVHLQRVSWRILTEEWLATKTQHSSSLNSENQ